MELLFQSRKLLIFQDKFSLRAENMTTSCYLFCFGSEDYCRNKCKALYLSPPPAIISQADDVSYNLALALTITSLFLGFFCICAYALYSEYKENRSLGTSPSSNPNGNMDLDDRGTVERHVWYSHTRGIESPAIASITAVKYRRDDNLVVRTDCAVCLSEFQEDEDLRLLPQCSHAFHVACIDTWLRSNGNCPLCRTAVLLAPENPHQVCCF